MPTNPELATATDLDQWASRREAQELLPATVRRLLSSTPGVTDLSMRAGDGIGVPGWDGRANGGPGAPYVPAGWSAWEMSTSEDIRDKAQENYRKRTDNPLGVVPSEATFVFVTPRRWGAKDKKDDKASWIQAKLDEGVWRGVRALDADDLEGWLESNPAVHIWLSERMGLRPTDVETLERWWESWSTQTDPTLPARLLLAGRSEQAESLRKILGETPKVIGLSAPSRDEAMAFVAAALLSVAVEAAATSPAGEPLASVLIVSTSAAWARVAASQAPVALVPNFGNADVTLALRNGHHVIVPLGSADNAKRAKIVLPRLGRDEAREVFRATGCAFHVADRLAAQARRSLRSLRRDLAINPEAVQSEWARRPEADVLAPLMLVGSWSADSPRDQEIISSLAKKEYADLERDLQGWNSSDDPPFVKSGRVWRLAAPLDAWGLLNRLLTRDDLGRWRSAALGVLLETDPTADLAPAERVTAGVRGIGRIWSDELRRGLAEGVAMLGAAGPEPLADGRTGPDLAASLVRELLGKANADVSGRAWKSLTDVLPLLAEGAPEQFLDGVEAALGGDPPLLRLMFTDAIDDSIWGASSPHTGLLWALERVCWSAPHLARAALALARLVEIDPGGRLGNRPDASLHEIFLPWAPQTSAPLRRRLAVIDMLSSRFPGVAWSVLLGLLPSSTGGISNPTEAPVYQDWKPERSPLPASDFAEAVDEIADRLLAAVADSPRKWRDIVPRLRDLPAAYLDRAIQLLESITVETLDPGERQDLWAVITTLVSEHRQFSTAPWALPDEPLRRLESIATRIEPADLATRYAGLFDWSPDLAGTDKFDHGSYSNALAEARRKAVQETIEASGTVGLVQLAEKSKQPWFVGATAAEVAGDASLPHVLSWLTNGGASRVSATGFVARMAELHGWDWVTHAATEVARLSPEGRSGFYLSLPPEPRVWSLVDGDENGVKDLYWKMVPTIGVTADNAIDFAERLLDRRRLWSAIELLARECHGTISGTKPSCELVERALRSALSAGHDESPRQGMLEHYVGMLLTYLERADTPSDAMLELEWLYLPILDSTHAPRALYARLSQDPGLFVDMVCAACRPRHRDKSLDRDLDPGEEAMARQALQVLFKWRRLPGAVDGAKLDGTVLRAWIDEARRLLAERDRAEVGDTFIGEMLSGSPLGEDGAWPTEPIRDIIEDLNSEQIDLGMSTGKQRDRGATVRGPYDGGKQEKDLYEKYLSWAEQVGDRWPRTGEMLRGIAKVYELEARYHDQEAHKHADEG